MTAPEPVDALLLLVLAAIVAAVLMTGCGDDTMRRLGLPPAPPPQIVPLPARRGCAAVRVDGTRCVVCQGTSLALACDFGEHR